MYVSDRFEAGFLILNKWLKLHQDGKSILGFFADNDLRTVAVYGLGALGERLLWDLREVGIDVLYAVDRAAESKHIPGLKIYSAEEPSFPQADVIIVTPVHDYWAIVRALEAKTDIPIVSLEDVIEYCVCEA